MCLPQYVRYRLLCPELILFTASFEAEVFTGLHCAACRIANHLRALFGDDLPRQSHRVVILMRRNLQDAQRDIGLGTPA